MTFVNIGVKIFGLTISEADAGPKDSTYSRILTWSGIPETCKTFRINQIQDFC